MLSSVSRYILPVVFLMNYGITMAQEAGDGLNLSARVQSLVSARYQATRCPGLSVAVASRNKVIVSQAYGMADLEQGVRLTTGNAHRLASLSKPVTATMIMELVQKGRCHWTPRSGITCQNYLRHTET